MDRRGPKLGDAASLWNFTPSPGWTKEESLILKLCLMKFGIGQWVQIQATGLLPGKLIQQLNGATQRLLGQQSLAAFSGLRVDIDRVRAENEAKTDARRKNGLIIWSGSNPTKDMKLQWQQEAKEKYGLTPEQQQEAEAAYADMAASAEATRAEAAAAAAAAAGQQGLPPDCDVMSCDVQELSVQQKQQLLCALHAQLAQLVAAVCQQQPRLAERATYLQQHPRGWVAEGLPLQQAAEAAKHGGAKENVPGRANMVVRQTGRARRGAAGKGSSGKGDRPPAGKGSKKRGRPAAATAAAAAGGADGDDDDDDFVQQRGRRQRAGGRGGRSSSGGEGGGGALADLMRVALDAGVRQLVEMGYSRSKAQDALRECGCDVELAIEFLTAACC